MIKSKPSNASVCCRVKAPHTYVSRTKLAPVFGGIFDEDPKDYLIFAILVCINWVHAAKILPR